MRRTTRFFKALSDRNRLRILWLLFRKGDATSSEIHCALGISEFRTEGHITYLLNAGVITSQPDLEGARYRVMQQTDPFRRATLEGLRCRLGESEDSRHLDKFLDEER